MFHLHELGWSSFFQQYVKPDDPRVPARIVEEQRSSYRVASEAGELAANLAANLRHGAVGRSG